MNKEAIVDSVKNSMEFYPKKEIDRLKRALVSKNYISKEPNLFSTPSTVVTDENRVEDAIINALDSDNFKEVMNEIEKSEYRKYFKYGSLFKIQLGDAEKINEKFFTPLETEENSITDEDSPSLFYLEDENVYIIKFIKNLSGVRLNLEDDAEKKQFRYPIVAMFYPQSKIVDIKLHTVPAIFRAGKSNFYEDCINEIREALQNAYNVELDPVDLSAVINSIEDEDIDEVKISSQKMNLATGGNATLDSGDGDYSDEVILPILGELKKIIEEHSDLFGSNETGIEIKTLLNDFITDTEETSELPWLSLRWPNEVKANTLQVKFIFDYNASRDFTLMQFYTNTRGLEGMIYVTRFLIKRIEKNS